MKIYFLKIMAGLSIVCQAGCAYFFNIDTEFTPGFSDSAFYSIGPGLSKSEVRALLGKPFHLSESEPGDEGTKKEPLSEFWIYSKQRNNANYYERIVEFGLDEKVIRIEDGVYWD